MGLDVTAFVVPKGTRDRVIHYDIVARRALLHDTLHLSFAPQWDKTPKCVRGYDVHGYPIYEDYQNCFILSVEQYAQLRRHAESDFEREFKCTIGGPDPLTRWLSFLKDTFDLEIVLLEERG